MENEALSLSKKLKAAWRAVKRPVDIYAVQQFALHLDQMLPKKRDPIKVQATVPLIVNVTPIRDGSPLVVSILDLSQMLSLKNDSPTFYRLEIGAIPDPQTGRHTVKTSATRTIPQHQINYLGTTLYGNSIDKTPREYSPSTQSLAPLQIVDYIESKVKEMTQNPLDLDRVNKTIQRAKDISHCGKWYERLVQGANHPGPQILTI